MNFIWDLLYYQQQATWLDLLDILLVTAMVVWIYTWVRGTRAFKVLLGLAALFMIYLLSAHFGMVLTQAVLQGIVQVFIVFLIVIFAPEIRQVLERLNPMRIWNLSREKESSDDFDEIVAAGKNLARNHIGALLVIEREDPIDELVRPGVLVEGKIREQTLVSFFQPKSPTHDGAVWIRNGMVYQVGVFLPISDEDHPSGYGSRHRAALGLSEKCDALVLVVSEENGNISVVEKGVLRPLEGSKKLESVVQASLKPDEILGGPGWSDILVRNWRIKLSAFAIVSLVWVGMISRTESQKEVVVPLQMFGLSDEYVLDPLSVNEVQVVLRGRPLALSRIQEEKLNLVIDLKSYGPDDDQIQLSSESLKIPSGIEVASMDPESLVVHIRRKRTP